MDRNTDKPWCQSLKEIATHLGVGETKALDMIVNFGLPARKRPDLGKAWWAMKTDLDEWVRGKLRED